MPDRADVAPAMVYIFDGSLAGLLCCVYERYTRRERVEELWTQDEPRISLYPTRQVETDEQHARRVYGSLEPKLGIEGRELLEMAFLSCEEDKDITVFRFIELGYRYGARVCNMLTHPAVLRLHKLHRAVWHEQHQYMGFVRFCEVAPQEALALPGSKNALAAVIQPKHSVLPLISRHFCTRFPEEDFIIYDRTHKLALVYCRRKAELVPMEGLELPSGEADEQLYRRLWKGYYDAVAIQTRINPNLRRSHMPKRYWELLPELQEENVRLP